MISKAISLLVAVSLLVASLTRDLSVHEPAVWRGTKGAAWLEHSTKRHHGAIASPAPVPPEGQHDRARAVTAIGSCNPLPQELMLPAGQSIPVIARRCPSQHQMCVPCIADLWTSSAFA